MGYKPAVDGIRALAVFMVVGFHSFTPGAWGGYLGVDVFFVLSGFLITTNTSTPRYPPQAPGVKE